MDLSEVRKEIDRVDGEIKKLFEERMRLADEVARIKAESEDIIFKPDREKAIIDRLTDDVQPDIKMEYTALIKRIMEISRKYQYGRTLQLRNCFDIDYITAEDTIFNKYAMVKTEAYLKDEIIPDSRVEYTDTYNELAGLIINGTVEAGVGIMEDIGFGVSDDLHSILCENELYINSCKIVNDSGRKKKVVTFSRKLYASPKDDRLKLMFVCYNKSGSLASVLSMISDYGINLTEIHSKPNQDEIWNYIFMIEMTASLLKEEDRALLYQLEAETEYFRCLGSYSVEEI